MEKKTAPSRQLVQSLIFFGMVLIFACKSSEQLNKEFLYFQNDEDTVVKSNQRESVIVPHDMLTIQVFLKSLNQDQALPFNLPVQGGGGSGSGASGGKTGEAPGYQVELDGTIEMPIIGVVKVGGLTKSQLQTLLKEKLSAYIREPSVIIRFSQLKVNILGEVKSPGNYNFPREHVTIIDAIGAAGDLTDYGKRKNVQVIREEANGRKYYNIDLTSREIFESPAYHLQPNDIVYVAPTDVKLKRVNNKNTGEKGLQYTLGIVSILTGIFTIIALNK
jgi:polysaccharide export outer membrane protein